MRRKVGSMWKDSGDTGVIQGVRSVGGLGIGPTTVEEWELRLKGSREGGYVKTGGSR